MRLVDPLAKGHGLAMVAITLVCPGAPEVPTGVFESNLEVPKAKGKTKTLKRVRRNTGHALRLPSSASQP